MWQLEVRVYPDARAACKAQAVCSLQGAREDACMMDMDQCQIRGQIYVCMVISRQ